jgi:hypothetical protein
MAQRVIDVSVYAQRPAPLQRLGDKTLPVDRGKIEAGPGQFGLPRGRQDRILFTVNEQSPDFFAG